MVAYIDRVPSNFASFAWARVFGTVFFGVSRFATTLADRRIVYSNAPTMAFQVSR